MLAPLDSLVDKYTGETHKETLKKNDYFIKYWVLNKEIRLLAVLVGAYSISNGDSLSETGLMVAASVAPAYLVSSFYFGSFWSGLGNFDEVKESFKQKPQSTVGAVISNCVLGNFYQYPYMIRMGEEIAGDMVYGKIEKMSQKNPRLTKFTCNSLITLEKAKHTYWNAIGKYIS